jgi:Flp pilus assembly protein TadG
MNMLNVMKKYSERMRSESGSVLIMVGFMIFLLIMAVGVAVDMTRAQILQQRISTALDAAGLAAAQTVGSPPTGMPTQTWADQEASRYFNANFPTGYLGSSTVALAPVQFPNGDTSTLALSATTSQAPVFMQTFGVTSMNVGAKSQVTRTNNQQGMELVLVLDDSSSMNGAVNASNSSVSKIDALKTAINGSGGLLDILFGGNDTAPNLYVGVVPFSEAVNIAGAPAGNWMNGADPNGSAAMYPYTSRWEGCVTARSSTTISSTESAVTIAGSPVNITLDISDDVPSAAPFNRYYYPPLTPFYSYSQMVAFYPGSGGGVDPIYAYKDPANPALPPGGDYYVNFNPWGATADFNTTIYANAKMSNSTGDALIPIATQNDRTNHPVFGTPMGPNMFCPPAISPMMDHIGDIQGAINTLASTKAVGNTNLDLGMAWAWRMLSPAWQGLWADSVMSSNGLPLAYNTPNRTKVIVLMTDGTNWTLPGVYSAYGFLSDGALGGTTTDPMVASEDLDKRTLAVCQALKDKGVTIFTIGFGTPASNDPPLQSERQDPRLVEVPVLQNCATNSGYFFLAPTNADLQVAFIKIGNVLQQIRVSQ